MQYVDARVFARIHRMSYIRNVQAPNAVVMVRPWRFHPNPETATDNAFQGISHASIAEIADKARLEFDRVVERLESAGIHVHLFDDKGDHNTPDSVFPNNWFSTHVGGYIALYPMFAPSRRRERRSDIIAMLKAQYCVQEIVDYSCLEHDSLFLEGTGAMVFDHVERVAYAAISQRCNPKVLERFCARFHYEPLAFDAVDAQGKPVYHTNVLMCIGTAYALVCSQMISDAQKRHEVLARLASTGRTVIDVSVEQIGDFVGNGLELTTSKGNTLLAMSQRAYQALTAEHIHTIQQSTQILAVDIPTIELAGGSLRCMLAGIHLTKR